jgi:ribonuclease R
MEKRVLTLLAKNFFRPTSAQELARELNSSREQVDTALIGLVSRGILEEYQGDYFFNPESDVIAGYYQAHIKGYGFVHVGGDRQYYVAPGASRGALDGDIVLGEVQFREPGKAPMLRITDFLVRNQRLVAARFHGGPGLGSIQDGNRRIMIPPRAAGGAREGDCVLVAVSGWEGRVVSLLDSADAGRLDLLNIAARRGITPPFPREVEEAVAELSDGLDREGRLDLRSWDVVTVDGESTQDLDDGFSLYKLANGNWQLGIHIADVAYYVPRGSALDREAARRALSVYLLDREIPMLPPRLSRDLCSLLPGAERAAVSCLVQLTPQGEVESYQFAETAIRSRARLNFAQVDRGDCGPWNELMGNALAVVALLRRRRQQRGAAYIELPAPAISLDAQARPVDLRARQTSVAREMVEEFMVLANELAADFLHARGVDFLYRGNAGFQPGRGEYLNSFLTRWGHRLDYPPAAKALQQFLAAIASAPELVPVSRKLARCLQKSRYSCTPMGHYNLALERYLHFSSPIRRYADLFTHRLLKQVVRGGTTQELERDLPWVAEQCSFRERLAQDVEGECLEQKRLQFMEAAGDTVFSGLVVDVTGSGPWVLLDNTAEGMVVTGAARERLAQLSPGDSVAVRVHKLDYKGKQLYFALVGLDKEKE